MNTTAHNHKKCTLPIDVHLSDICAAIDRNAAVIVKAEPGTGKTTRLPAALLAQAKRKIVVLEPRRLAAKLSAERVASESGCVIGKEIGYQVRFDNQSSAQTRLMFITEGIFLRWAMNDADLRDIDVVVLDEFHERNIYTDLALALVRLLQKSSRPDLKLVVMSATLETRELADYLQTTAVFDIKGKTYPVTVEYHPPQSKGLAAEFAAKAVFMAAADLRHDGNILVFMTGVREILDTVSLLKSRLEPMQWDVCALAGELPPAEQQRVFTPSSKRKVVVATNIAETSLTIPDVTAVVDLGNAKISGYAAWSGMPTLDTLKVSQASLIQRAGRAGRVKPGIVYRIFGEADFLTRPPYNIPDIQRIDLQPYLLSILSMPHFSGMTVAEVMALMPWYEQPHAEHLQNAIQTLNLLGALEQEKLSPLGREMANLPLHPRTAAVALAAISDRAGKTTDVSAQTDVLLAACMIHEGVPFKAPDRAMTHEDCDIAYYVQAIKAIIHRNELPLGLRPTAVLQPRLEAIRQLYRNLAPAFQLPSQPLPGTVHQQYLARCLLAGFPDRLAQNVKQSAKADEFLYHFCLGRGGVLNKSSVLYGQDYIVVIEAQESKKAANSARGTVIHLASSIALSQLLSVSNPLKKMQTQQRLNTTSGKSETWREIYYGELLLESVRQQSHAVDSLTASSPAQLILAEIKRNWPWPFADLQDLDSYHHKVHLLQQQNLAQDFPVFQDDYLELLQHAIADSSLEVKAIQERGLREFIFEQLTWEQQNLLKQEAPDVLNMKNGRTLKLLYRDNGTVIAGDYIQTFYGLTATPTIAQGRIKVMLELWGPNKRPAQVTSDLNGFWQSTYQILAKEFRRDYPRHHWAEEPQSAKPLLLKRHLV